MDDGPVHRNAINVHVNVQSKTVFSHAMTVMDNIDGLEDVGGFEIRGMHVNLHKNRAVWWTDIHAEILEAEDVIHHGKCEQGLQRSFRRTWVGIRTHHYHEGRRSVGGVELLNRCPVVLCTVAIESNI